MSEDSPAALTRYGRDVSSVFDLLGRNEVDLTAALAWSLAQSPSLMAQLWSRLEMPGAPDEVTAALEVRDSLGRTDLELTHPEAAVIVEAKKGWLVPGESQLAAYAPRLVGVPTGLLVSLSDSSGQWAEVNLPAAVAGVPVRHVSWDDVRTDLAAARAASKVGRERLWLEELNNYLAGATSVRSPEDQWTYCVVVTDDQFGTQSTFREFVRERRVYFHPYGGSGGWPKRPPTFMAFRWQGRVRQINRVVKHEVVAHLGERFPDTADVPDAARPHMVYDLGSDIPAPEISTNGTYATGRVWALLDQLLTSPTLRDAYVRSKAIDPT